MSKFIAAPNLPCNRVESLICGELNEILINFFHERNIEIFHILPNQNVDQSISKHSDISALYLGNGKIVLDKKQLNLAATLRDKDFSIIFTEKEVYGEYPEDCLLNFALTDSFCIGRIKSADISVVNNCMDLDIINVNQGYAKCSCLIVDENSIITDDPGIFKNAGKKGINCLLIEKGDILLDGHGYGFIGGASGKISKNELVFFGDITKHRNYYEIKSFLDEREINIISFDEFPITDFGGIIPLTEK